MSLKAIAWAKTIKKIPSGTKFVLVMLAERHHGDTDICCPDQEFLAEDCNMDVRSVRRHLRALAEDYKLISRQVTRTRGGEGKSITYYGLHFHMDEPLDVEADRTKRPVSKKTEVCERRPGNLSGLEKGGRPDKIDSQTGQSVRSHIDSTGIQPDSSVPYGTASGELFQEDDSGPVRESGTASKLSPRSGDKGPRNADTSQPSSDELHKSVIFTVGFRMLTAQDVAPSSARAFLGGLIKNSSAKIVAESVTAAASEMPIDARAWLRQAVERRAVSAGIRKASDASPAARQAAETARIAALERRFAHLGKGGNWQAPWGPDPRICGDDYPPELYEKHGIERPGDASRRRA